MIEGFSRYTVNHRLADSLILWSPRYEHTVITPPPPFDDTDTASRLAFTITPIARKHRYYIHPDNTDTPAIMIGHPDDTDTPLFIGHPAITVTHT